MSQANIGTKVAPGGNSFNFIFDEVHASHWSFTDEDSVRAAWWHIKPGEVVLDIGCAYGSYSFPALAQGAGKVIAWAPENYKEKFLANAMVNGWSDKVEFHDLGLWSQAGWLQIFDGNPMPKFLGEKPAEHAPSDIIFEVKALDEYQFDRVDWIKMDVEGCEVEVLRGAAETIRKHRPKILIENHLFKDGSINQKCEDMIASAFQANGANDLGYHPRQEMPYHSVSHSLFLPR